MAYYNPILNKALAKIQQGHYYRELAPAHYAVSYVPDNINKFRISALPFCPLLHVMAELDNPQRKIEFESGFYFKVGHAVHDLWQTVAKYSLPDKFIGDWRCGRVLTTVDKSHAAQLTVCNRVTHFSSFNAASNKVCPHQLKNCAPHLTYQELQMQELDLSGHTDFLLHYKGRHYGLVDFKTTSSFLFDKPKIAVNMGYYPSEKYINQIRNYLILLERKYNIIIDDYTIAYQAREKALQIGRNKNSAIRIFSYRATNKMRRQILRDLHRQQGMFNIAQKWLQAKDRSKITTELYESRPCHRARDYVEKMKFGFFGKEQCPHHLSGACYKTGKGSMLRKLQKLE